MQQMMLKKKKKKIDHCHWHHLQQKQKKNSDEVYAGQFEYYLNSQSNFDPLIIHYHFHRHLKKKSFRDDAVLLHLISHVILSFVDDKQQEEH